MAASFDPGRIVRDLTGAQVSMATGVVRCTACKATIDLGAGIKVYAYRRPDESRFRVARVYCTECNRVAIRHPTLGILEVLVGGQVCPYDDRLVLREVAVRDVSPPTEGSR